VEKIFAEGGGADGVRAECAEGLSEGADQDVGSHAELSADAATAGAEGADGVGFVHHEPGVVLGRELGELGQGRDVAVHREDGLGCDQAAAMRWAVLQQEAADMGGVGVIVDDDVSPGEAGTIDEARVIEAVGEEQIAAFDQGRNHTDVGLEAGVEEKGRIGPVETGELDLEGLMVLVIARDEARGARAEPGLVERGDGSLPQGGVAREAEIVVGREAGQPPPVEIQPGALHAVPASELTPKSRVLDPAELVAQNVVESRHARNLQGPSIDHKRSPGARFVVGCRAAAKPATRCRE
jgi:hypothetical protein